jgi:hypothetical protein
LAKKVIILALEDALSSRTLLMPSNKLSEAATALPNVIFTVGISGQFTFEDRFVCGDRSF